MSAVAGIFRRHGALVQPEELSSMLAAASDRGPDGSGTWHGGQTALAHQAFLIDRCEPVAQLPPVDDGSGLVLSWDGRLDNADELRRRLEAASADPFVGTTVARVLDADEIRDGEIGSPLEPFLLKIKLDDFVQHVDRIADDLAFDVCVGTCMRDGQPLATSVGAPTFRLGVATVVA